MQKKKKIYKNWWALTEYIYMLWKQNVLQMMAMCIVEDKQDESMTLWWWRYAPRDPEERIAGSFVIQLCDGAETPHSANRTRLVLKNLSHW